ncbi:hypothetical protein K3495_g6819 [Podosphaera aphanis]|nr:hypothetical protein K3495_g6819 [Podosphaera aphanis]
MTKCSLIPTNPEEVMVIRDLLPGVTTLSVPFARFGKLRVGGRATIVKLATGMLAVFSPVTLTPTVRAKISSITSTPDPVGYLIAPNIEHHIFLSSWSSAYPKARVIGMEPLAQKRIALNRTDPTITLLDWSTLFTSQNKREITISPEFDAEFDYEYIDGHINRELVFVHKPTKTLIEADLLFNLPATEQYSRSDEDPAGGLFSKAVKKLDSTKGDAIWQKRITWYGLVRDRPSFTESIRIIDSWDFTNLVPCHGDSILGSAKSIFKRVFDWYLV